MVATAVLTYLTSQRRQDILALRLSEIREDGIHVTQLKLGGKVKVVIEWTDALRTAVTEARAIERPVGLMYVICNRQGQRYTDSGYRWRGTRPAARAFITTICVRDPSES